MLSTNRKRSHPSSSPLTNIFEDMKEIDWLNCAKTSATALSNFLKQTQILTSLSLSFATKAYLDSISSALKDNITLRILDITLNSQMYDTDSSDIQNDAVIPTGLLTENLENFYLSWYSPDNFLTITDWKNIAYDMTPRKKPLTKFYFKGDFIDPNLLSDLQHISLVGDALIRIIKNTEEFKIMLYHFPKNLEQYFSEGLKNNTVLRDLDISIFDSSSVSAFTTSSLSGKYIGD